MVTLLQNFLMQTLNFINSQFNVKKSFSRDFNSEMIVQMSTKSFVTTLTANTKQKFTGFNRKVTWSKTWKTDLQEFSDAEP